MLDRMKLKLYCPYCEFHYDIKICDVTENKMDKIEFKLYCPYSLDYDSLKNVYHLDYGSGYTVRTAIIINGAEIVSLLRHKWDRRNDCNEHGRQHFPPGKLYKNLTSKTASKKYIIDYIWVKVKEDEKSVHWDVYEYYDDWVGVKRLTFFTFDKVQYYEALGHLQQLIGQDVDERLLNKPLLAARMKTLLERLKEQRKEEKLWQEELQKYEKVGAEIEEKLKQAEENGIDAAGAYKLARLYDEYCDPKNADLWYSKTIELGNAAACSCPGKGGQKVCDSIRFDLFYPFHKEWVEKYEYPYLDDDDLRRNGRPLDIATGIYINGDEILTIMADKWRDKYCDKLWEARYGHLGPERLFNSLNFMDGFWTVVWHEPMTAWKDGGIVGSILAWARLFQYDSRVMVSVKEDGKFVYWRVIDPYELEALVGYSYEECKFYVKSDTTGENDLFFKFTKGQYYAELAKLAKWCDKPEPNRTMWLERLADILVTRQIQRLEEDD